MKREQEGGLGNGKGRKIVSRTSNYAGNIPYRRIKKNEKKNSQIQIKEDSNSIQIIIKNIRSQTSQSKPNSNQQGSKQAFHIQ